MAAMRLPAKICGLSTPEGVEAAIRGGAGYLGFNFFAPSPRCVEPEAAARLAAPARAAGVSICAITVDAGDDLVDRIVRNLAPDFLQLHGKEPPGRARELAGRTGAGLIRALPVGEASARPTLAAVGDARRRAERPSAVRRRRCTAEG